MYKVTKWLPMLVVLLVVLVMLAPMAVLAQDDLTPSPTPTLEEGDVEAPVIVDVEETPTDAEVTPAPTVPGDVPEDEFNQDIITDLIKRGTGIASEVVFGIIALVVGGFLALGLPLGFALWRSFPQPIKAGTYPLADEGMRQYSTRLQQQAHYLKTNENPDDDFLIPDMVQRLRDNERMRKQFADEAAAAGIQVNFVPIEPMDASVRGG